jgi:transcription elongation factor SPT6
LLLGRTFIFNTNSGVDINRCASNVQFSGTLQFVSGLGPRKAQAIISKIMRKGGKLSSRQDLILDQMCSGKIFINCASFIRIKERHFDDKVKVMYTFDPLDDTRIHPEDYDIARKMAADALDVDDTMLDEDNPSQYVSEIMQNDSDRLLMLMLDDYADELERSEHKLKKIALNEMRDELMAPYLEKRRPFEGASVDECFKMLTSETDETLHYGALVNCQITRVKERFLFCLHDSGMEGIVHVKNVDIPQSMEREPNLERLFAVKTTIAARVLEINKERLTLELDIRKQSVLSKEFNIIARDPTFSREREAADLDSTVTFKRKENGQVRSIQHPFFKNMDFRGAEEYLSTRPRGEIVVRPSTKGNDHISITWKLDDGIYQHIGTYFVLKDLISKDVLEKEKENQLALGRILKIDNREFLEIDQIIAEHVEPMTRRINEIIQHVKFQRKNRQEMNGYIEIQGQHFKNQSMYGFIISDEKPGLFYLVYKHPANSVRTDTIVVQPEGFIFRNHKFRDVESLLRYFKQDEAKKAQMIKGQGAYQQRRR